MSYYTDHRVRAAGARWYTSLNEQDMTAEVTYWDEDDEEASDDLPFVWAVCPTCRGRGKHVNPSIDSGGISREDFDRDPDFEEDYMAGRFDVTCYGCKGRNVVAVLDRSRVPAVRLAEIDAAAEEEEQYQAICAAERRFGC